MRRDWILKTVALEPPPWRQRIAGRRFPFESWMGVAERDIDGEGVPLLRDPVTLRCWLVAGVDMMSRTRCEQALILSRWSSPLRVTLCLFI